MSDQDSRILLKTSNVAGELPSVAPSSDHTDGTWSKEHIYIREIFVNTADDRAFLRTTGGILEIAIDSSGTTGDSAVIYKAEKSITSVQVLSLNTTKQTLVTAAGAGTVIEPVMIWVFLDFNSAAYATNTQLRVIYDSATSHLLELTILAAIQDTKARMLFNSGGSVDLLQFVENEDLKIEVASGDPITGDSPITIYTTYMVRNV